MGESGREPAAETARGNSKDPAGEALGLMEKALRIIDANDGPHDVGAHLDLAIHRLRESMTKGGT